MARPKPQVLLEYTDKNFFTEHILAADAIYAVFYNNKPFSLKSFNSLVDLPGAKYKKTVFPNKAHCINLANRLNSKFKTKSFTVVKIAPDGGILTVGP
jgi:hypothetical protein